MYYAAYFILFFFFFFWQKPTLSLFTCFPKHWCKHKKTEQDNLSLFHWCEYKLSASSPIPTKAPKKLSLLSNNSIADSDNALWLTGPPNYRSSSPEDNNHTNTEIDSLISRLVQSGHATEKVFLFFKNWDDLTSLWSKEESISHVKTWKKTWVAQQKKNWNKKLIFLLHLGKN